MTQANHQVGQKRQNKGEVSFGPDFLKWQLFIVTKEDVFCYGCCITIRYSIMVDRYSVFSLVCLYSTSSSLRSSGHSAATSAFMSFNLSVEEYKFYELPGNVNAQVNLPSTARTKGVFNCSYKLLYSASHLHQLSYSVIGLLSTNSCKKLNIL